MLTAVVMTLNLFKTEFSILSVTDDYLYRRNI